MPWSEIAIVVQTASLFAVSVAAIALIGVLGGQWKLKHDLTEAMDEAHQANTRITREIKTRAGQQGVEARQEAKSINAEAAERLAAAPAAPAIPSTLSSINGGVR